MASWTCGGCGQFNRFTARACSVCGVGHSFKRDEGSRVATSNPSAFDDGKGKYFVMSPRVRRTYASHSGAIDHATNLIREGNSEEFLIVKVIGRVRKKPIPVEYVEVRDEVPVPQDREHLPVPGSDQGV